MRVRRLAAIPIAVFVAVIGLSSVARAQSAIAGTVRDESGAVLPGVSVEASSEALIERVRSVVTDSSGEYRIVNLRPGIYQVTFTLAGFSTVRREGLELPADFTATANAQMSVGALEESITVSGDSPMVDVQNAAHTQVLSRETIDALPSGHSIWSIGQLMVGVSLNNADVGGTRSMQMSYMSTHGMSAANNTVMIDGLLVNGLQNDGTIQAYYNEAMNQEVSYQTSGISADTSAGGVRLNMIPREGGNRFAGSFYSAIRPRQLQADNLTERLRLGHPDFVPPVAGIRSVSKIDRLLDFNAAEGGPLKNDRLWFFTAGRFTQLNAPVADTVSDDGSQGIDDQYVRSGLVRLTWQISPRNKLSAHYDRIDKFRGHDMTAGTDPETASMVWGFPLVYQGTAKYTSTVSSKLLFEGGYSSYMGFYTNVYQEGVDQPAFTPQWYALASRVDLDRTTRTTAGVVQNSQSPERYAVQSSVSYVTGSHNLKTGFLYTFGRYRHTQSANADLYQQYRSGIPDSVQVRNTPLFYEERLNADFGVYVQDSWRFNRLTINAGLRWEHVNAQVSNGTSPAGRFVGERHFDKIPNVPLWNDWAPRFTAVYDVFGNAKTALKFALNRYNRAVTTGVAQTYNPLGPATAQLPWRDLNGDDIAQGERGCTFMTAGCEIDFALLPRNFGTLSLNTYADYPRMWNLEKGVEVQHELLSRLSVSGTWFQGTFYDLTTSVNTLRSADDYTPIQIFNPMDGTPITVYNLAPDKRSAVGFVDGLDPNRRRSFNFYSLEFRARPSTGTMFFGGVSFERELNVACTRSDDPTRLRFCDDRQNALPYRVNAKLSGSYALPWHMTVSGVLQSQTGNAIGAQDTGAINYQVTPTTRYPANCPAPCPAGALVIGPQLTVPQLIVPLVPFNKLFAERINQLDLKLSRAFKVRNVTLEPTVEAFNLFNSDTVNAYRSVAYATSSYLQPSVVLNARLIGVGFQMRW